MVANRGYASTESKSRQQLIEAASQLLEEEGAHAISARRVAAKAGLKPQLVHYYFRSMEDLIVEVFRLATAEYFDLHSAALGSPRPLRALWQLNSNMPHVRKIMAFVSLGAIHEKLAAEMKAAGEGFRAVQERQIDHVLSRAGIDRTAYPPASIAMMMAAVARTLAMEAPLGVQAGHRELRVVVERFLDQLEP